MRGRWAAGIVPRNFAWIITDCLAVSERPGGYAPNHRKVRRQEELLWLRAQGFNRVISLLSSPHNLYAYGDFDLAWSHFPLSQTADAEAEETLAALYPALLEWLRAGERVLVHQDELGDRIMGVMAGYIRWSGILPDGPQAITIVEQILSRQMGSAGRRLVALVDVLPPPLPARVPAGAGEPAGPGVPGGHDESDESDEPGEAGEGGGHDHSGGPGGHGEASGPGEEDDQGEAGDRGEADGPKSGNEVRG
jgi:hypothetical protein